MHSNFTKKFALTLTEASCAVLQEVQFAHNLNNDRMLKSFAVKAGNYLGITEINFHNI